LEFKDSYSFLSDLLSVKSELEIKNAQLSSKFTQYAFKNLIGEIESAIDEESSITHERISSRIERVIENEPELNKFAKITGMDPSHIDFSLPVMVQSGNEFDLTFGLKSDKSTLKSGIVLLSVSSKYKEINTTSSRTLVVNPEKTTEKAYDVLLKMHNVIIGEMKPSNTLAHVYNTGKAFMEAEGSEFVGSLTDTFGFGIGMENMEEKLAIEANNDRKIEPGMLF
jgi:nucleosome binding factor SPN SPT16 subunit